MKLTTYDIINTLERDFSEQGEVHKSRMHLVLELIARFKTMVPLPVVSIPKQEK